MLETWRAQTPVPPHDVNRDALRQALQTEEARVRRLHRTRRRVLWFLWIFGTDMAVWAGFWIAISITNGWPATYAIAAGVSFGMFSQCKSGIYEIGSNLPLESGHGFRSQVEAKNTPLVTRLFAELNKHHSVRHALAGIFHLAQQSFRRGHHAQSHRLPAVRIIFTPFPAYCSN
jgi:hypothetical protein